MNEKVHHPRFAPTRFSFRVLHHITQKILDHQIPSNRHLQIDLQNDRIQQVTRLVQDLERNKIAKMKAASKIINFRNQDDKEKDRDKSPRNHLQDDILLLHLQDDLLVNGLRNPLQGDILQFPLLDDLLEIDLLFPLQEDLSVNGLRNPQQGDILQFPLQDNPLDNGLRNPLPEDIPRFLLHGEAHFPPTLSSMFRLEQIGIIETKEEELFLLNSKVIIIRYPPQDMTTEKRTKLNTKFCDKNIWEFPAICPNVLRIEHFLQFKRRASDPQVRVIFLTLNYYN